MNTIMQCFFEKIINLEEKSNNINFLSDLTDDMNRELMDLGKQMIVKYLKDLEEIIFDSDERKYISYQKDSLANNGKLITIFGEIKFSRKQKRKNIFTR